MKQYAALDDTMYLWFASNDTSGSGGDGASAAADVRLAGAAADAAPVYSPTPALLTHVDYPAGAYEVAIAATAANGFATGNTYAVFCTLAIDSQNPTGFVGSFDLKPVDSNMEQCGGSAVAAGAIPNAAADAAGGLPISAAGGLAMDTLADWVDGGRLDNLLDAIPTTAMRGTDSATLAATWTDARAGYLNNLSAGAVALAAGVDLTSIHGAALTETVNGYLAAAFTKLFDVATPLLVSSEVMRGTDGANTTVPDAAGVAPTAAEIKTAIEAAGSSIAQMLADTNELQTNQGAWLTATGFSTHNAADVKTAIEAAGSSIATILADTNELQTDWANGGRLDLIIDAILDDTSTTLDGKLDTILGLNQENFFIDNTTYSSGNMTGGRIRIYSVAGSVGTASDVIATYTITATYAGSEMTDYKVVKS